MQPRTPSQASPPRGSARAIAAVTLLAVLGGLASVLGASAAAEDPKLLVEQVRNYRRQHESGIVDELRAVVAQPNLASDAAGMAANAELLRQMLHRRGIASRLLETPGSPPAVFGELIVPGASRTVVFYAHYDGQPVVPERWQSPPWQPTLRDGRLESGARDLDWSSLSSPYDGEWRVYARSASDDKAPIVALLVALDALRASSVEPSVNLKFFFEGEEEAGSQHLGSMLEAHRAALAADLWLFCDGPVHQSRRQQVVFGVRGVLGLQMTVYGALRPLHSGHYGNWAPNPAAQLATLVASMRDAEGTITIDGFYDRVRPLTDADRLAIASVPSVDGALRDELGLAGSEDDNAPLIERIMLPALNVQGLAAAEVGTRSKNAIPTEATVAIDFRLVPDLEPDDVRRLVESHVRGQGFNILYEPPDLDVRRRLPRLVHLDWGGGYRAMRTPLDLPASRAVLEVADGALELPAVRVPILGGSLPMYLFEEILDVPLIVVPIVNHDNNQHAPNENLRLQNLWDGIELYASLYARLGTVWR